MDRYLFHNYENRSFTKILCAGKPITMDAVRQQCNCITSNLKVQFQRNYFPLREILGDLWYVASLEKNIQLVMQKVHHKLVTGKAVLEFLYISYIIENGLTIGFQRLLQTFLINTAMFKPLVSQNRQTGITGCSSNHHMSNPSMDFEM